MNRFNIRTFLSGKKTYLTGAIAAVVMGLSMYGVIPAGTADQILVVLGFGGLVTLRSAVATALTPKPKRASPK
tara:strand:+ start:73 stop:291 length:219 start_codon:yes stop_codon:yes gene_type:complete